MRPLRRLLKPPADLPKNTHRRRALARALSLRIKIALPILVAVLTGGIAGTYMAFSATSQNPSNSYAAGTVTLTDDDGGAVVFNLSNMKPADAAVDKCINVTYSGSLAADVRFGSDDLGTGNLKSYITLKVTRGTLSSPSYPSCTSFTADTTNYIGQGAGVVYNDYLANLPTTWATGIVDPTSGSPETWTNGETHAYKLTIDLDNNPAAQGLSTTAINIGWEAHNQ